MIKNDIYVFTFWIDYEKYIVLFRKEVKNAFFFFCENLEISLKLWSKIFEEIILRKDFLEKVQKKFYKSSFLVTIRNWRLTIMKMG